MLLSHVGKKGGSLCRPSIAELYLDSMYPDLWKDYVGKEVINGPLSVISHGRLDDLSISSKAMVRLIPHGVVDAALSQ